MTRLLFPAVLSVATLLTACERPDPRPVPDRSRAYVSHIQNQIVPLPGQRGVFEVIAYSGNSAAHFRCSAAEYAERALGLLPNRRIYLLEPLGPSKTRKGRRAITFTVLPSESLVQAGKDRGPDYTLDISVPGESFMIAAGRQNCRAVLPLYWDLF